MAETVAVQPSGEFSPEEFADRCDRFKEVLILPRAVLRALFPDREPGASYVAVSAPGTEDEDATVLPAIPFGERHRPRYRDGQPVAFLRVSEQREVGALDRQPPTIEVRPLEVERLGAEPLCVSRESTFRESTREVECRVAESVVERSPFDPGQTVEVANPVTGGRAFLTLGTSEYLPAGEISLSTAAGELLRVDHEGNSEQHDVDSVVVRDPVVEADGTGLRQRASEAVLNRLVGHTRVHARTVIGLNADENRGIVRVDPETLNSLGIEAGDRVMLESRTGTSNPRCLPIDPDHPLVENDADIRDADISPRTVLLPSTQRQAANAMVDDVVELRRDMHYVVGKRVTLSMFGLVGALLGVANVVNALRLTVTPRVGLLTVLAVTVAIVWLTLWPERQRCT